MLNGDDRWSPHYTACNAITPLLPEVMEAMRRFGWSISATSSSIHMDGQQACTALDRARERLAEFFNCHDAELVFNSVERKAIIPPSASCTLATPT